MMKTLPAKEDAAILDFSEPNRRLESIVLPGNLTAQVAELLDEWRQTAKLARFGLKPRNRVLLHGPSGNGKTTLAAGVATELGLPLAHVRSSDVIGSHLGEASRNVATAFRDCGRRACIMFFDEADSMCGKRFAADQSCDVERNNIVNTILLEMDRLPAETVVFFATNFAEVLDPAMRRRINLSLELPAPSIADMERLLAAIVRANSLLEKPLKDFDVAECGATSFAQCEQIALDHARRWILNSDDPLGTEGKPRSAWLREQLEKSRSKQGNLFPSPAEVC